MLGSFEEACASFLQQRSRGFVERIVRLNGRDEDDLSLSGFMLLLISHDNIKFQTWLRPIEYHCVRFPPYLDNRLFEAEIDFLLCQCLSCHFIRREDQPRTPAFQCKPGRTKLSSSVGEVE